MRDKKAREMPERDLLLLTLDQIALKYGVFENGYGYRIGGLDHAHGQIEVRQEYADQVAHQLIAAAAALLGHGPNRKTN